MKLSAYIVKFDTGFAPNPFGRHCTLACCKPTIRRCAKKDDIVVGTASARYPHAGKLVYAMRVAEVLPYQRYWDDPRFRRRRPSPVTAISRRGDNIWHKVGGRWRIAPGAVHDLRHRNRDTGGVNALVATEFFYFGREAISVPDRFAGLLATTQGHKNTYDSEIIGRFWNWIGRSAPKPGRIGDPLEFDDEGYWAQCQEVEDDDVAECELPAPANCGPDA
jgi:hypothetical protein